MSKGNMPHAKDTQGGISASLLHRAVRASARSSRPLQSFVAIKSRTHGSQMTTTGYEMVNKSTRILC